MERLTRIVSQIYEQYPFPGDIDYRVDYSLPMLAFLAEEAPPGKRSVLDGADILEAG